MYPVTPLFSSVLLHPFLFLFLVCDLKEKCLFKKVIDSDKYFSYLFPCGKVTVLQTKALPTSILMKFLGRESALGTEDIRIPLEPLGD